MATLLHILAQPTPETSATVRIATALLDAYRNQHPDDRIVTLDLYHAREHHLTAEHLGAMAKGGNPEAMTPEERRCWEEILEHVEQFRGADKFVVTSPMWNFGVPSILKAYVDHVVLAGYTFRYTGPGASVGMMSGKTMAIVSTRGGVYSQPPMAAYEMCVRYLHNVFGFLGVKVVGEVVAEGLALVGPEEQAGIIDAAAERAREVAAAL